MDNNNQRRSVICTHLGESKFIPDSELRYRLLFENMIDGYAYCETQYDDRNRLVDFVYLSVNKAFERLTGLKNVEGKRVSELIPGIREKNPDVFEIYDRVVQTGVPEVFELDLKLLGKWFTISVFSPEKGRFIAVFCDITDRKQAELELRIAATAFETKEGMLITDRDANIIRVNHAFTHFTGYGAAEVIGKKPTILKSGRQDAAFYKGMWDSLLRNRFWEGEIWNRRKNGEIYPEWLTITAVTNANGEVTNYVGVFYDITQRKIDEEKINFLAYHDSLTALPNRVLFYDRLSQAISQARRRDSRLALLFLDMDGFKSINDDYGHQAGDVVLQSAANRLLACVRDVDTVARLGGDEFAIVLGEIEKTEDVITIAEKIIQKLMEPLLLRDVRECCIGVSIGIAIYPDDGTEIDSLMSVADSAMYASKAAGKGTYTFNSQQLPAQ